jgi:aryl-alcohol dehydrogenase-like predicted oxidoreductase
LRKDYILQAAEASLRRLQVDCIDLYQSHWDDENTAFEETLSAYDQLIRDGKVRAIGASNLPATRLAQALKVSRAKRLPRYATLQPHYNLYERASFEGELQALCQRERLGVIPYFALAAGFLTGKYRSEADFTKSPRGPGMKKFLNPRGLKILDALSEVSRRMHATPAQVSLAWLMTRPAVTAPIASATNPEQLREILGAASLQLDADSIQTLESASR